MRLTKTKQLSTLLTLFVAMFLLISAYLLRNKRHMLYSVFETHLQFFSDSVLFKEKPLVIWSNDYHISPINDLKHFLQPLGVKFIDKSLSGHCWLTNTCEGRRTLKVIDVSNAMDLDHALIPKFYEAYKDDEEMKSVDAFVCFHPTSMCELFEPFNKSLIIIASTRYELGRFGRDRWSEWNENLRRYASKPGNVVGGNNLYDAEYVKYFTGIQTRVIESYCGYINSSYSPTRRGFLVAPILDEGFKGTFFNDLNEACVAVNCTVEVIELKSRYVQYSYSDLTAHLGMIYVPYQVSVMSMIEQYRMNIPMFFPSKELLTRWQHKHRVMIHRTWTTTHRLRKSDIEPFVPNSTIPDPNNEQDEEAIRYWIEFSDFYQFPHIQYYDSVPDLVMKLQAIQLPELMAVSEKMRRHNVQVKKNLLKTWRKILTDVAKYSANKPR